MSLISRITTWTVGQFLKSADLNGEFNNLVNVINNLDGGTTTWTNVKVTTLSPQANVAMGGFKLTGLGAGTTSGDSTRFEQLKVISVGSVITTVTPFTTTSGTFVSTNLSGSITPSSSSNRVLVFASGCLQINNGTATAFATLARGGGGTNLFGSSGGAERQYTGTGLDRVPCTLCYIDSPATTSSTAYAVHIRNGDGSSTVGFGDSSLTQVMILAEIV